MVLDERHVDEDELRTFLNDGAHYDSLFAALDDDLAFWTRRAAGVGGPVLELACGTGRVALAMAEAGLRVVGIDVDQGGLFVLDAFNFSPTWPRRRSRSFSYADPTSGATVQVVEERWYDPSTRVETVRFTFADAPVTHRSAEVKLGLYTGAELTAALQSTGFEVTGHLGNYDETPYFEAARYQILIATGA